jgi:type VI secretion system secreted protein Hcp
MAAETFRLCRGLSNGGAAMTVVDAFLKLGDIKGESQDHKHKDEIHIESWSWGETQTGTLHIGGGGGGGKVSMQDLRITKRTDSSSPRLMLACASGEHFKQARVTTRKAGEYPLEFLKITLWDVLVSSYETSVSGVYPVEHVSLNFAKIQFEYTPQKADGSGGGPIEVGWDIKATKQV